MAMITTPVIRVYFPKMIHFDMSIPMHGRRLRVTWNPERRCWEARTEWWWKGKRKSRTITPHARSSSLKGLCHILAKRHDRALRLAYGGGCGRPMEPPGRLYRTV